MKSWLGSDSAVLDPELIKHLASQPGQNAPAVNIALAEEGGAQVLLTLCRSEATRGEALRVIANRMRDEPGAMVVLDENDERVSQLDALQKALIVHPLAPDSVRDEVLDLRPEPFFIAAAACHPRATLPAIELAGRLPARSPLCDRLWIQLIGPLPPLTGQAWSQDECVELRELVACQTADPRLLERLAADPARQVRRAVAGNASAEALFAMLCNDPAAEVRSRAKDEANRRSTAIHIGSARFAAAVRALEKGGVLSADVAGSLTAAGLALDTQGALLAGQVLPGSALKQLIEVFAGCEREIPVGRALAAGYALRDPAVDGGKDAAAALVGDATQALARAPWRNKALVGKARLAAWLGAGLAEGGHGKLSSTRCLAADSVVLGRAIRSNPEVLTQLCQQAQPVHSALLEAAWKEPRISDEKLLEMVKRLVKQPKRGRELPDDELDLDPNKRDIALLEQVVLSASRQTVLSARCALSVVGLDARRVRYVLTALPSWSAGLTGAKLARVLKQNAGALTAGRAEARPRAGTVADWTERILSDTEMAVAIALGHFTCDALVQRLQSGRHKLRDGVSVAFGAEARAALEGPECVRSLAKWARSQRLHSGAACAIWLLLEDRPRSAGMIGASIDGLAVNIKAVDDVVIYALATVERRSPGRLEAISVSTAIGKASLAGAVARAYRALGGLPGGR